jgi:L-lactate permease
MAGAMQTRAVPFRPTSPVRKEIKKERKKEMFQSFEEVSVVKAWFPYLVCIGVVYSHTDQHPFHRTQLVY